ncbi:TetR/AcrR family transcriptional regulator [Namhaeicola litoreus]|uniref:TetR/AcrR family transcriptional regulator n=1 Tax=Namhaeicola litoreus TaxID=1052145 RepID=A0ABW3Y552_9FLAO
MDNLLSSIKLSVPDKIYLKDPESSELGKRIIENSILLMNEIGFDNFTFKKLGLKIGSNESSIYRYFESKHKLLVYLSARYWAWIEYQLVFETHNISNSEEKLRKAIHIVTRSVEEDISYSHINEILLHNIIVNENSKSFLTKEVDNENKEGYFAVHKRLVSRLKDVILSVSPKYPYPTSLASTIIEGGLHQHFLKDHFKSMTDCDKSDTPTNFFTDLTFYTLKSYQNV